MRDPDEVRSALRDAASGLPTIYDDPAHYDVLAQMTAPADVPLYRSLLAEYPGTVLELGCGSGRVALALAEAGAEVTGVELVEAMIEAAAQKAAARQLPLTLALGDMRSFDLGATFGLVLIPYNGLNHLLDHDAIERALTSARRHMDVAGRLVIDTFQPSLSFLSQDHSAPREILRYRDPYLEKEVVLSEENHYDAVAQINDIVWRYEVGGVADARVDQMRMRMFFPQELDGYLRHAGLVIEHKWGDYDRRPFDARSPKQLVVCRCAA